MKKKILMLHTNYRQYGGEDVAVENEILLLKKKFEVKYLNFSNSDGLQVSQINGILFNFNNDSAKKIMAEINTFKPDLIYVHNSWYKLSLHVFEIAEKLNIPIAVKLHNFRYDCANSLHFRNEQVCHDCSISNRTPGILNRCYENSFTKY